MTDLEDPDQRSTQGAEAVGCTYAAIDVRKIWERTCATEDDRALAGVSESAIARRIVNRPTW